MCRPESKPWPYSLPAVAVADVYDDESSNNLEFALARNSWKIRVKKTIDGSKKPFIQQIQRLLKEGLMLNIPPEDYYMLKLTALKRTGLEWANLAKKVAMDCGAVELEEVFELIVEGENLPILFEKELKLLRARSVLYCICRKPYDQRAMIACDRCDEWYHFDCINLREPTPKTYICPACRPLTADNLPLSLPTHHDERVDGENLINVSNQRVEIIAISVEWIYKNRNRPQHEEVNYALYIMRAIIIDSPIRTKESGWLFKVTLVNPSWIVMREPNSFSMCAAVVKGLGEPWSSVVAFFIGTVGNFTEQENHLNIFDHRNLLSSAFIVLLIHKSVVQHLYLGTLDKPFSPQNFPPTSVRSSADDEPQTPPPRLMEPKRRQAGKCRSSLQQKMRVATDLVSVLRFYSEIDDLWRKNRRPIKRTGRRRSKYELFNQQL
ncbi:hypothetical protein ACLOJK_024401 [Asimina triloba]